MVFGNASVTEFKFDRNASAVALLPKFEVLGAVGNATVMNIKVPEVGGANNGGRISISRVNRTESLGSINLLLDNLSGGATTYISFVTSGFGTPNAERMRITNAGNIGIGTNAPSRLLSLVTSSNDDGLQIRRNSSTTNDYGAIGFRIAGTEGGNYAELRAIRTNRVSAGDSDLTFLTSSAFGSPTEKMRIRDDGNVGIGTTSPQARLEVANGSSASYLRLSGNGGNVADVPYAGIEFFNYDNSADGPNVASFIESRTINSFGVGADLVFGTITSQTGTEGFRAVDRMKINGSGLVGINETAPTAQLQVKSNATDRVGLAITTTATSGYTANIASFSANNLLRASIEADGLIRTRMGVSNSSSNNNSRINLGSDGATITRNVDDSNPALIVNQIHASSTGNITQFQKAGTTLSTIANNGVFVGQSRPTRTDITANATLALVDEGKVLRVNSASNLTLTIPLNSSVAFPIDTEIAVLRYGTGTVSISPTSGVTLNSKNAERKISGQYGSVALKKIGTDEWVLVGSLEA
jgi:hypothetical protein